MKVNNLVVGPSAQGRGYGRMLMEFADSMAREQGPTTISPFTNEKMHGNIALYSKMGFMETGRKAEHGYNRVLFSKILQEEKVIQQAQKPKMGPRVEVDCTCQRRKSSRRGLTNHNAGVKIF